MIFNKNYIITKNNFVTFFIVGLIAFGIFCFPVHNFAYVSPGLLEPGCAPTDTNCTVAPPITASSLSTSLSGYVPSSALGAASGVATLDSNGKIPNSQVPSIAIGNTYVKTNQSDMLGLSANVGDVCVRTDLNETFILQQTPASTLSDWIQILTPGYASKADYSFGANNFSGTGNFTGGAITGTSLDLLGQSITGNSTTFQTGSQSAPITYTLPTNSASGLLRNTSGTWSWDTNSYLTTSGTATDSSKLNGQSASYYQTALGYTAENTANKNVASGYAGLNSNAKFSLSGLQSSLANSFLMDNGTSIIATTSPNFGNSLINFTNSPTFGIQIGGNAVASGGGAISIGGGSKATANDALAFGGGTWATANYAVALGADAQASGVNSVALGSGAIAAGVSSTAIGQGAEVDQNYATAIGAGASTNNANELNFSNNNGSVLDFNGTSTWNFESNNVSGVGTLGAGAITGSSLAATGATETGYAVCYLAGGTLGHCTSVVGSGGTCTCVAN